MSDKTTRLYDFGPFRLNTAERWLLREGEVVQIPPKIFDLLLAFLERRGRQRGTIDYDSGEIERDGV